MSVELLPGSADVGLQGSSNTCLETITTQCVWSVYQGPFIDRSLRANALCAGWCVLNKSDRIPCRQLPAVVLTWVVSFFLQCQPQ